jgi:hypothetical protein
MDIWWEHVGPRRAEELLSKKHPNQRKSVKSCVSVLAHRIKNGKWDKNAGVFVVDKDGFLIDGQHRLHAIVKSSQTVCCRFIVGQWSQFMDDSRRRDMATRLSISKDVASLCRHIARSISLIDNDEGIVFATSIEESKVTTSHAKPWGCCSVTLGAYYGFLIGKDAHSHLLRLIQCKPLNASERRLIVSASSGRIFTGGHHPENTEAIASSIVGKKVSYEEIRSVLRKKYEQLTLAE